MSVWSPCACQLFLPVTRSWDRVLNTLGIELVGVMCHSSPSASIIPDYGATEGFTRGLVPCDGRFALVRDSCRDATLSAGVSQGQERHANSLHTVLCPPCIFEVLYCFGDTDSSGVDDFFRIVFVPSITKGQIVSTLKGIFQFVPWIRIILCKFDLMLGYNYSLFIEYNESN
jgi:hypothetical protein